MKGLLITIATAAILGLPVSTGSPRQPLQIAEIETVAAEAKYIDYNSTLQRVSEFPVVTAPEPIDDTSPFAEPGSDESLVISSPESGGWQYYGVCTITFYCAGPCCCGQYASGYTASGTRATANRTVAMSGLPFGTEVMIDGQVYVLEDRGVSGMWVDIFVDSHDEALRRGMYEAEVWIR